jgi:MFS family permease
MTPIRENSDKGAPQGVPVARFAALGGQIGCLTLLIVLGSVFGGLWLDRVLGTKPAFTIILLLGSAPIALVLTFWMAMRSVKDLQPPVKTKSSVREEEDPGE